MEGEVTAMEALWTTITDVGTIYLNYSNYEEIKLSIVLKNAINYEITYFDNLENSNYEFNYFDSSYCRLKNNYKNNKYIIFSSYDNISGNIYIKSNNPSVYADYYDTEKSNFSSFGATEFYRNINNTNYYKFYYENIGPNTKKGFYITNNKNDNFDYYVYIIPSLYYSFNNNENMNNSIFIDSNGNIVDSNIKTYYADDMTNLNDMFDYIKDNNHLNNSFNKFTPIWNIFKKNGKIYTYLMLVITTSIIILVLKSMGK